MPRKVKKVKPLEQEAMAAAIEGIRLAFGRVSRADFDYDSMMEDEEHNELTPELALLVAIQMALELIMRGDIAQPRPVIGEIVRRINALVDPPRPRGSPGTWNEVDDWDDYGGYNLPQPPTNATRAQRLAFAAEL